MKKNFTLVFMCLLILFPAVCFAGINPDHGVQPGKPTMAIVIINYKNLNPYPAVLNNIVTSLKKSLKSSMIDFIVYDDAHTSLMEYLEDKKIDDPTKLQKADWVDFGNRYKYTYVTTLDFNEIGMRQAKDDMFFSEAKYYTISAQMIAKTLDVRSKTYAYRRDIVKEGTSTAEKTILPMIVLLRERYSPDDIDAFYHGAKIPLTNYMFSGALLPTNQPCVINGWKEATEKCIREFAVNMNEKYKK